jgi:hypothetical protein
MATGTMAKQQKVTLYDLGEARNILDLFLLETEGEETPEIAELWAKLDGDIDTKIERWALYLRELHAEAEVAKAEAKRLAERAASTMKAYERGKAELERQMKLIGREKVKTPRLTIWLQDNNPGLKVDEGVDLEALHRAGSPLVYEVVEYRTDYAEIVARAKNGGELPKGIRLETTRTLRTR